jgi:hypothetical protein
MWPPKIKTKEPTGASSFYVSLTVALFPFLPDQVLRLILVLQNIRNKQNAKEMNKNFWKVFFHHEENIFIIWG